MRRTRGAGALVVGGLLVSGLALVGCGQGGPTGRTGSTAAPVVSVVPTAPPTTAVDLAGYARRYLDVIGPGNEAARVYGRGINALPDSPTGAQIATVAAPMIAAWHSVTETLLRVDWPASVRPAVESLVTAVRSFETDLGRAADQNLFTYSDWSNRLTGDEGAMSAAVSIVRADLGLPPAPTS